MEAADLTGLVIRALGMIVGKMVRDELDISDGCDGCDIKYEDAITKKQYFLLTTLITSAAQQIAELEEIDLSIDHITTKRVGRLLTKMRLPKARPNASGRRGWNVTLNDVRGWASSYGLESAKITGISTPSLVLNVTPVTPVTNVKPLSDAPLNPYYGVL